MCFPLLRYRPLRRSFQDGAACQYDRSQPKLLVQTQWHSIGDRTVTNSFGVGSATISTSGTENGAAGHEPGEQKVVLEKAQ
jgi:hypothetical protein